MIQTITVAELLSDAGKDVREASVNNRGQVYDADEFSIIQIVPLDDDTFCVINRFNESKIVSGDYKLYYEFYTPTPDPLALAEAALRPFAEGYRAYMESRAARNRRDIRDWIYFNADEELLERHYEQAAAALAAIEAARKGE